MDLPLVCLPNEGKGYKISVRGLKGGHSGADIHLQRANANCLMGRILDVLQHELEYDLVSVDGGNMDNAICREADAVIVLRNNCALHMREILGEIQINLDVEFGNTEPNIMLYVEAVEEDIPMVLSEDTKEKIIQVLLQLPYGVQTMSADMEGLVESSNNIGIVKTLENTIYFDCAMRSSVEHKKIRIYDKVCSVAKQVGGIVEIVNDYPGWEYNPNSEMLAFFGKVYEDMYGKAPRIEAIHAGLECGLFAQKMPGLDMVSIGPEMYDVHTPDERLSIASTLRVWDYLKTVLANIK
ncbi:M20/M25/M40 family metallo-hydrolase [Chakrabartyella piscis]|uniref:M20/M25/M40 family metallo-hydrolase n=1 Tax=Chakrabartyella piscis TaxID=2918914 RepID=UPI0029589E75|nr:M20/M25/M40 family metallo-hydrolase [Chakrabartyella piscis]